MELGDISNKLKSISVTAGSVFKTTLYKSDGVKPKKAEDSSRDKYFVILGEDESSYIVGVLLINTNINSNLAHIIAPYQHCIYPDIYEFLDGQYRFVDCYKIKTIERKRILSDASYIGIINEDDMKKIAELAKASPGNLPNDLKRFNIK